ncbi:MAG TPA: SRPBCC domain-containing protein [Longimicrobiaceae bacterium]|nr:SRPBCC domain-containing protein [Longimicrobiaceae bacterium]
MSVRQEASGRRSVQIEFEVPGTPDEVWQAIATGPGVSSWFVPARFEERDGKPVAMTLSFGPGAEPRSEVTAWDPPRTFALRGDGLRPGSPPMGMEWTVEARAGGTCTIRIVHSLFASTDEWDDQLEATKGGWAGFLDTLRLYLTHFRGQSSALMQVAAPVGTTDAETWDTLTGAVGLKGCSVGQRCTAALGVPPFAGVLEHLTEEPYDALVRLDTPGPGIAALGAVTYPGGQGMVAVNLYMYGDGAAETVARQEPLWQAWIEEHFGMPAPAGEGA